MKAQSSSKSSFSSLLIEWSFGSSWNSLKGLSCTNRKKINVSAWGSSPPTHSLYQTHDSFSQWGSFIFYLNIWMKVKKSMHAIIVCRFVTDILRRMLWLGSKTQVKISWQVKVSGKHKANSPFRPILPLEWKDRHSSCIVVFLHSSLIWTN